MLKISSRIEVTCISTIVLMILEKNTCRHDLICMKMFRGADHVVEVVVDLDVEAWPVDDLGL